MHAEFWHQRWADGHIGFHRVEVNPMLEEHFQRLSGGKTASVFLPLCGKSLDIGWLAQRCQKVIGVELSARAVHDFFYEHKLQVVREPSGLLEWWTAENIRLACGDFFHLTREDLAGVSLVYDRAALIALPAGMRSGYAAHLADILEPGSRILLVTLEYEQSRLEGPPFSVDEAEVQALFAGAFDIELIDSRDALEARFRDRGLTTMREKAYILQRHDTA